MEAKILVVDDEESIRYTFDVFLSEKGHAVSSAASYDEALQSANSVLELDPGNKIALSLKDTIEKIEKINNN